MGKERKSSPDTDSTTSSMGAGEPYVPASSVQHVVNPAFKHRASIQGNGHAASPQQQGGMLGLHPRSASFSSSVPSTLTAHSVGSLPSLHNQMATLRFGSTPTGASPITRPGILGLARPSSSIRSGADDPIEDDEDEWNAGRAGAAVRGGKKSSEEAEEYSMAMDMEL